MDITTQIILAAVITIVALLILREFRCWYWKINERVEYLDEIRLLLKEINKKMSHQSGTPLPGNDIIMTEPNQTDTPLSDDEKKHCPSCSKEYFPSDYREDAEEIFCSYCNTQLPK